MKQASAACYLSVLTLSLASLAFATVVPAAAQTLNPPPPSFLTCKAFGDGTICQGARTVTEPLADGFPCTSGGSTFEVFNADQFNQHGTRFYDRNGNLTARIFFDEYSFGQFSNQQAGTVLPYKQVTNEKDTLAVPGDLSSAKSLITGEIIFKPAQGAPVAFQVGLVVTNPDYLIVNFEAGPDDLNDYFLDGDPSALAALCAALA